MSSGLRPHLLGLLLIVGVIVAVERLIVTDEEAIEAVAEELAGAIAERQFERLEGLLAPEFQYGRRDRSETIRHVQALVRTYQPVRLKVTFVDIRVEEDRATADGVVSATVLGRPQQVRLKAIFARSEDDEWLLEKVTTDGLPR